MDWTEMMADDPEARALYKRLAAAEADRAEIANDLALLEVEARKADLSNKEAYEAHLAFDRESRESAQAEAMASNERLIAATELIAEKLGQIVLLLEGTKVERVTGGAIYPEGKGS